MSDFTQAPTLSLHQVRLEPLNLTHESGLRQAVCDGELWHLLVTNAPEPDAVADYIQTASATRMAFAVIDERNGRVVGSTSFYNIDTGIPRLEIGYTWYAKSAQRTHINTACKLMLMTYAFETLGCQAVGWYTDIRNTASQRAIERLGARQDGILRRHMLRKDGSVRDSVVYSLLREEWPAAKAALSARLTQA